MSLSLINQKLRITFIALVSLLCFRSVKAQSAHNPDIKFLSDTSTNFQNTICQFKSKIIYVDIWATWCGPCRHELQKSKVLRAFANFAKKNDIVILYICSDYNIQVWKQFVNSNNLVGYHVVAGQAMLNDFHTTFSEVQKRRGAMKRSFYIPRHLIVDQSGTVVDSMADSQGKTIVYKKLEKLLRKGKI